MSSSDTLINTLFDGRYRIVSLLGQGGMGIQTAPAASLLCASLVLGEAVKGLDGIDPNDFAPN